MSQPTIAAQMNAVYSSGTSTRVSALMRQIDASEWLDDPEVERVETRQSGSSRQSDFVVYLKQKREGSEEEME